MDNLNFTPRTINEIEDQTKKPITAVIADVSMRTITLFVKKGLNLKDDNEASDAIDTYLSDDKDIYDLYMMILERLQTKGFLPRALDLKEVKTLMQNPETFKAATSVSSGVGENM